MFMICKGSSSSTYPSCFFLLHILRCIFILKFKGRYITKKGLLKRISLSSEYKNFHLELAYSAEPFQKCQWLMLQMQLFLE